MRATSPLASALGLGAEGPGVLGDSGLLVEQLEETQSDVALQQLRSWLEAVRSAGIFSAKSNWIIRFESSASQGIQDLFSPEGQVDLLPQVVNPFLFTPVLVPDEIQPPGHFA